MTTDFREYAQGIQPLSYYLVTCPGCGYTERSHRFGKPIPEELKEFVHLQIAPLITENRPPAETRYEIAAKMAEFSKKPLVDIAGLLLKAAWCAEDREQDTSSAKDYRRRAIAFFIQALDSPDISEEERLRSMYLIGEEYRRIGEVMEAEKWFQMLIAYCGDQKSRIHWARLAWQQMEYPREKFYKDEYLARICLKSLGECE
jgi:uncharacterized protein (DUF2225 family)